VRSERLHGRLPAQPLTATLVSSSAAAAASPTAISVAPIMPAASHANVVSSVQPAAGAGQTERPTAAATASSSSDTGVESTVPAEATATKHSHLWDTASAIARTAPTKAHP